MAGRGVGLHWEWGACVTCTPPEPSSDSKGADLGAGGADWCTSPPPTPFLDPVLSSWPRTAQEFHALEGSFGLSYPSSRQQGRSLGRCQRECGSLQLIWLSSSVPVPVCFSLVPGPFHGHPVNSSVFRHQQLSCRSRAGAGTGTSGSERLCLNLAHAGLGRGLFHDLDSCVHALLHVSRALLTTSLS